MDIRRAQNKDMDSLLDLLSQVLEIHAKLRPDIFLSNTTKYRRGELERMIQDDDSPIYVILENEKVLGYAFCQIRPSKFPHLLRRKKTFYIDDLCVDKKSRGKHVGKTLFKYIEEEAKKLGCDEMTLNCWEGNEVAKDFYESMGFRVRSCIMERPID